MPLPEFAVPNAAHRPARRGRQHLPGRLLDLAEPLPHGSGRTPACEIPGKGAIRVCDLFDRPLVLSFWFTRGADCLPTQDVVDRVAARYRGRVNFLSINVRDDPADVRDG